MASTPICRCRVLYLGSAVPHVTKDGLHGIQEPLRELYPEEGVSGAKGIDSWLSVWSNGLLLENVDEKRKRVTRFFPIDSLHYCAAVRHVTIPGVQPETGLNGDVNGSSVHQRFLPLDSPFARIPSPNNPPLFACILRRTSGIKVLECHAFVCKKEMAANALVRCCFHAYADNTFVKQLETGNGSSSIYGVVNNNANNQNNNQNNANGAVDASVNPIQKVEQWRAYIQSSDHDGQSADNSELVSIYDNNENHKVWTGNLINETHTVHTKQNNSDDEERNSVYPDYASNTLRSNGTLANGSNGHKNGRPRQLTAPSNPPPPPPLTQILNESDSNTKSRKNNKNAPTSKHINGHNGHGGPHRYQSSSEFRPMWLAPRFMSTPSLLQNEGMYAPGPPHGSPHGPPHGPPMMPMLMPPGHPPPTIPSGKMKNGGPRSKNGMEEPIYVPVSTRPFKNGGNLYHPGGFPYAEDPGGYYRLPPGPMGVPPPTPGTPIGGASNSRTPTPTKYKKKKDKSNSDSETKYSTGIYRKKGHLNERAFSYSIRQEHRSRSHSSLATLSFNAEGNAQNSSDAESPVKNGSDLQVKNGVNGHSKKNGNGTNGHHHTLQNGSKNGVKGSKTDPGFSSDSSLGRSHSQYALNSNGHVNGNGKAKSPISNNNKKMALKTGGHHKSELNIRDLHLSDSELNGDYPTLKAKSKQVNKKMAAKNSSSNNNVKALHNKR